MAANLEKASNESRAAFVTVHSSHGATVLDVGATSVIGDTLQREQLSGGKYILKNHKLGTWSFARR